MNFLLDASLSIYVAMIVVLVVWLLVFLYLLRIDRQARELRHKIDSLPPVEPTAPRIVVERRVSQDMQSDEGHA